MSELAKEKLYRNELIKVGGKGKSNLERIRSLANSAINSLKEGDLKISIVETLPTENIATDTLYVVSKETTYDVYMYVEEDWELICTTI